MSSQRRGAASRRAALRAKSRRVCGSVKPGGAEPEARGVRRARPTAGGRAGQGLGAPRATAGHTAGGPRSLQFTWRSFRLIGEWGTSGEGLPSSRRWRTNEVAQLGNESEETIGTPQGARRWVRTGGRPPRAEERVAETAGKNGLDRTEAIFGGEARAARWSCRQPCTSMRTAARVWAIWSGALCRQLGRGGHALGRRGGSIRG
jgi:hypothetical protein